MIYFALEFPVVAKMPEIVEKKLLPAIKVGDVKTVKSLLNTSMEKEPTQNHLNFTNGYGETLLHAAVEQKNKEIVELLVNYFDDVCRTGGGLYRYNKTPLMVAAEKNQEELVNILLDHGANVNAEIEELTIDDIDCLNEIIEKTESALISAVTERHDNIVKILLNHGATVIGFFDLLSETWKQIFRDLMNQESRSTLDLLMSFGPQSKQVGEHILFTAIEFENIIFIKYLLQRGVDIEARNFLDCTPLMLANSVSVAQILLDHGAKASFINEDGRNSLHCAVENDNLELVRFLYNNGASVDLKSEWYGSPLTEAVYSKQHETVDFLLECGAPIDMDGINDIILDLNNWFGYKVDAEEGKITTKIVHSLLMYAVKLQAEESFAPSLDSHEITKNDTLLSYYKKCKDEMERIKQKKFTSTDSTLFDILKFKPLDQLTSHAENEEIGDYLKTEQFKRDFPIYSHSIVKQFEKRS